MVIKTKLFLLFKSETPIIGGLRFWQKKKKFKDITFHFFITLLCVYHFLESKQQNKINSIISKKTEYPLGNLNQVRHTNIMKVATPRLFLRSSSTQACAATVVSTTIKSSPLQAVDMAISYFAARIM